MTDFEAAPTFTRAIVRTPARSLVDGLTSVDLGVPDYDRALAQHQAYVDALVQCGLDVTVLPADERYPDSVFVEDVALLSDRCAIITRPGAPSRQGETALIREAVAAHYDSLETIEAPGTVEAGDIMMVGGMFYIGLSDRTNEAGATQMIEKLRQHGLDGKTVAMSEMLHLKTGMSYLEQGRMTLTGEFVHNPLFEHFERIEVPEEEAYAVCSLWINGTVIVPAGHPRTRDMIEARGYPTLEVDSSEFRKIDGGLSCLSLRF